MSSLYLIAVLYTQFTGIPSLLPLHLIDSITHHHPTPQLLPPQGSEGLHQISTGVGFACLGNEQKSQRESAKEIRSYTRQNHSFIFQIARAHLTCVTVCTVLLCFFFFMGLFHETCNPSSPIQVSFAGLAVLFRMVSLLCDYLQTFGEIVEHF